MNSQNLALTDEQLLETHKNKKNCCIEMLYTRYFDKVLHKCLTFVKNEDEAYDLAQETLLKAFSKLDTFQHRSSFSTWLFSITCTECLLYLRQQKRHEMVALDQRFEIADEENFEATEPAVFQKEIKIDSCLHLLSEEDQELLKMKYWMHASVKEIQSELHLSTASAVKMRLQRARHKMLHLYNASLPELV